MGGGEYRRNCKGLLLNLITWGFFLFLFITTIFLSFFSFLSFSLGVEADRVRFSFSLLGAGVFRGLPVICCHLYIFLESVVFALEGNKGLSQVND